MTLCRCFLLLLCLCLTTSVRSQPADDAVTLLAQVDFPDLVVTDVWGFTQQDHEYVILSWQQTQDRRGVAILDATDPTQPAEVSRVTGVPGFDVKVWNDHAYVVTGNPDFGDEPEGRIIDLSDVANPTVVGSFPSAHNVAVSESGLLVAEFPGTRIYDLNTDPTNPTLLWETPPEQGHDASIVGNRLFDFHGSGVTSIYDITNPSDPQLLGSITDPRITYHHSGYPTEDGRYLFICDELAPAESPDITVWDISQPEGPVRVATIRDEDSLVHNLYIVGDYAYVSYYTAGFRVYDVSDPTQPVLAGEFDTSPSGGGLGAWGVYPFTESGAVYVSGYVSSGETGIITGSLHIFGVDTDTDTATEDEHALPMLHLSNYPNPFTQSTSISYRLASPTHVRLIVFDLLGREVAQLADGDQPAGEHTATLDADALPNGTYLIRLETPDASLTRPVTLLR